MKIFENKNENIITVSGEVLLPNPVVVLYTLYKRTFHLDSLL